MIYGSEPFLEDLLFTVLKKLEPYSGCIVSNKMEIVCNVHKLSIIRILLVGHYLFKHFLPYLNNDDIS